MGMEPSAVQDLSHQQLRALAKASRPWYRKKRYWALGGLGIVILASATGSSAKRPPAATGGVSSYSRNSEHPPQADVVVSKCQMGFVPDVVVTITNHSGGRSNYIVSLNILDRSGTKIGDGTAVTNNVEPGQTAIKTALASAAGGDVASCVVTEVNRFAAS